MRTSILVVTLCLALTACGEKASAPAAPSAEPTSPAAAGPTAAKEAPEEKVTAPAPAPKGSAAASTAPTAATPKPAADEAPSVAEPPPQPELSEQECAKACAHATALSMKSMPPDATADMRKKIKQALEDNCPKDCMKSGTKVMLKCILAAKSGMDLAACPK